MPSIDNKIIKKLELCIGNKDWDDCPITGISKQIPNSIGRKQGGSGIDSAMNES